MSGQEIPVLQAPGPRLWITAIEITDAYAADVLTTALEQHVGRWIYNNRIDSCECRDVDGDGYEEIVRATFRCHELNAGDDGRLYTADLVRVKAAMRDLVANIRPIDPAIVRMILDDDVDAYAADVILQVAAFGEVVYG